MLKIENVSYAYHHRQVLKQIHLEVANNEIVCLLGPNGSGKTTLLNCICGYLHPDEGDITLKNKSILKMSDIERAKNIAYIAQESDVDVPYRVFEMVLMGVTPHLNIFTSPKKEDEHKVMQLLHQLGLTHLANKRYMRLSGGEKQLVRLARGLIQESYIQLMDEPTAALDIKNELLILEHIKQMMTMGEHRVIVTTHNPNHAFYFDQVGINTKVALMSQGEVVNFGGVDEVITPSNLHKAYAVHTEIVRYTSEAHGNEHALVVPTHLDKEA